MKCDKLLYFMFGVFLLQIIVFVVIIIAAMFNLEGKEYISNHRIKPIIMFSIDKETGIIDTTYIYKK
jgi:uncharacterized Tic20 family protein